MADTTTFPPLFKILVDGKSSHGGRLTWSLPTQQGDEWTPGEWHGVEGEIQLCHNGLHVTDKPAQWWKQGATAYFVECEGDYCSALEEQESKIAFRRVRLLRPATNDELFALNVFLTGAHQVEKGFFIASGSATVEASGSATVEASGSATVEASDSATVKAYDSATVQASDSATVKAYDSATVEAYDSATVKAYGSATVKAYDSATVEAYDSATVQASDSATVKAYGSATVQASDSATVQASGSATVQASDSATVQASGSATVQASDSATVQAYDSATALISEHFSPGVKVSVKGAKASAIDRRSGKPVLITEVQTETK